jgi:hypothetical protein
MANHLQYGRAIPASLWERIPLTSWPEMSWISHEDPRMFLALLVNMYIYFNGGQRLFFAWTAESAPRLWLHNSLGFLGTVWLEIAQSLSGTRGLCQCDGCHKFYERKKRRPDPGKRNYCDDCGTNAAKRDSAQRRRQKMALTQTIFDNNPDNILGRK